MTYTVLGGQGMGNTIPTQLRSIDPYASYNSDIANRLTRIVTSGIDCLLYPDPIDVIANDSTSVIVTSGKCVKDDVYIEIQQMTVPLDDADFFVDSTSAWDSVGYYYVVVNYTYAKVQPANVASIGIIKPSQRTTSFDSRHLFLACLDVGPDGGGGYQVDAILDYDPDWPNNRRILRGADPSGVVASYIVVSTNYSADPDDSNIKASGNTTITLPPVATSPKQIRIIKTDLPPTKITVVPYAGDYIDNATSIEMTGRWNEVTLLPDNIQTWVEI